MRTAPSFLRKQKGWGTLARKAGHLREIRSGCGLPRARAAGCGLAFLVTGLLTTRSATAANPALSGILCGPVTEQLVAFVAEETALHGDAVIALFEDQSARDQASSPLAVFGSVCAAVGGNIFL